MTKKETPKFTHLHVHSHYSLLDGLSKIGDLLDYVKELGMDSVALTDHGNLYGTIEFYQEAKKRGIKPIIGMEGYVANRTMYDKEPGVDDKRYHIILLAKNNEGYKNLIALSSKAYLDGFYYKPRMDKKLLKKHSKGLIMLSGCLSGEIPRAILANNEEKAKNLINEYRDIFGKENFYLEVQYHPNLPEQKKVNEALFKLSKEMNVALVATQDSHYLRAEDAEAHDVLLAIQTGNLITDENRMSFKDIDSSLKSPASMTRDFRDHRAAIENTQRIADMCNVEIELGKIQLPNFEVPHGFSAETYLEKLCNDGLKKRYDEKPENIKERLNYELSVINKTGFASYMLIVQDFVNWAKNQNIIVGPGRGSAAGSLVSYLLGITNIDPIKYNLVFERFLNPDRISMPDIDLDFADTRRAEVLRYVIDKYGEDKVAQIITFGTMAARAAVRDVGRALGYPYGYCDKIAKLIPMFYSLKKAISEVTELKQEYTQDERAKHILDMALKLEGVVRHASVHACGVVITNEPLINVVPLQRSTQNEAGIITQFEMNAVESLGLLKMDFLGLKNLTIIENTLQQIEKLHGEKINIDTIPIDNSKTYQLLQKGDTTGVFQLESSGMRRYLKELKPTEFEDILSMVALYRPGPMDSIPDFIAAKHGRKKITYLHPVLKPILEKTYGVVVTQDQVLEIARKFAGFSYGEADILRKAVGKKIKKLLDEQKEKFIEGAMKHNKVNATLATKVWNFIEPFASYGFNRAHSACYARIAYETAYLKALYPTEFMASVLNAEQKHIDRMAFIIEEARDMGIEILPPSINESGEEFTVIENCKIRFGLAAIKNVGAGIVHEIIEERKRKNNFTSIEDILTRIDSKNLNKKSLESLTKAGALDELGQRNTILANMDDLLQYSREARAVKAAGQSSLFGDAQIGATPRISLKQTEPESIKQRLAWEKELLGFYISSHPLKPYEEKMKNTTPIQKLLENAPTVGQVKIGAIINKVKKIITKNGQPMMFIGLEDMSGKMEGIVFPSVAEKNGNIIEENKIILASGKISTRDGDVKFICESITELV